MLESRRLGVLVEVARRGSITAAAEALGYTPSAASQQIAALEQETGVSLLERGPRGVTLTEPGSTLLRHAERILAALDAAEADVQSIAGLRSGLLRLAWFATAGATLMPRAIAAFRTRHPGIELSLAQGDPDECLARLRDGDLDMALVYDFDLARSLRDDVPQVNLMVDRLRIALPADHRLASRARVSLRDLADDSWIQGVRSGSTLEVLPTACRAAGFEPKIAFRTDDHLAAQGLVAAGAGVALVPELTLATVRRDIEVREVSRPALVRRVRAALPPGRYRPPAVDAMLDVLREAAAEHRAELAGAA